VAAAAAAAAAAGDGALLYRLLGRSSVDVLKSGGYKLSALDVERELLSHPAVEAAAVVGLPDAQFGQRVAAVVQLRPKGTGSEQPPSTDELQQWCRTRMASFAVPRAWRVVQAMPRNAMGKTNKKELAKLFEQQS
jgi:malonyl-CoA/methylmalonyl-CoA synthetase